MTELATAYPDTMSLTRDGDTWHWRNELLDIAQDFVVGDESSLPCDPLAYIAGQVQDDIVLLDQRDGDLFADAGVVTFSAGWSFGFDVGMTFLEIHGPVPGLRESGVITRAREFLMRLQPRRDLPAHQLVDDDRAHARRVGRDAGRQGARPRRAGQHRRRDVRPACCICASRCST